MTAQRTNRSQYRKQRNKAICSDLTLQSLLYDLDLLPEQVKRGSRDEWQLDAVYVHYLKFKEKFSQKVVDP